MLVVGLTGGIGSGKSTFAALLSERGAIVIDADALGHQALAPGQPTWHSVVDQFGDEILAAGSMAIDRKVLGRIVFADPRKRAALNAIVHPYILRQIADTLEAFRNTHDIVVLDAALIVELGLAETLDVIVVMASSTEIRRARLIKDRGMTIEGVDARIGAQADPADLVAKADIIVQNEGGLDELARQADRVWAELQERNR